MCSTEKILPKAAIINSRARDIEGNFSVIGKNFFFFLGLNRNFKPYKMKGRKKRS